MTTQHRFWNILFGAWLPLLLWSCQPDAPASLLDDTPYTYDLPAGFPLPANPAENPSTVAKVALGKRLFYDPILSADGTVSCNSCHVQERAFAHDLAVSPGVYGRMGFRNSPTLANLGYVTVFHKDGGVPKLDMQAGTPIEDFFEMDSPIHEAAARLNALPEYEVMFLRAFDRRADAFTITRSLAAFIRTMVSGDAPYDRYLHGQTTAMNAAQLRGQILFFSERLACATCHSGFNFARDSFFNNGLKLDYSADPGRRRVTINPADDGKFRVPTLRNVAVTAPYMHDGSLPTLAAVVRHYNQGGSGHPLQDGRIRPLNMTEQEMSDVVAFLEALTDSAFLVNPAFRNE